MKLDQNLLGKLIFCSKYELKMQAKEKDYFSILLHSKPNLTRDHQLVQELESSIQSKVARI